MERANDRSSFVEDGIDRIQSAFQSVEGEFEKIQQRVGDGRKDFEKRLRSGRKDFQKSTKKLQKRASGHRGEKRAPGGHHFANGRHPVDCGEPVTRF